MNEEFLNGQSRTLRIEKAAVPPSHLAKSLSAQIQRHKSGTESLARNRTRRDGGLRIRVDRHGRNCDSAMKSVPLQANIIMITLGLRTEWNEIVDPWRAKSPYNLLRAHDASLPLAALTHELRSAVARNRSVLKANT